MKFEILKFNYLKNIFLLQFVLLLKTSFCYNDELNSLPINISQENQLDQFATQLSPNRIQLPDSFSLNNNPGVSSDQNVLNSFLLQSQKVFNSKTNQNGELNNDMLGLLQILQLRDNNNLNNISNNNKNPDLLKYIQLVSQLNLQNHSINNQNENNSLNLNPVLNKINNVDTNHNLLMGQALNNPNFINVLKNINNNSRTNNIINPESQNNFDIISSLLNNNSMSTQNIMQPLTNNNDIRFNSNFNLNFLQSLLKNPNHLRGNNIDLNSIGFLDNLKRSHLSSLQPSSENNIFQNGDKKNRENNSEYSKTNANENTKNLRKREESENTKIKDSNKDNAFKQIEPKQKANFSDKLKEELNQLKQLTKEADNIITEKKEKPSEQKVNTLVENKEEEEEVNEQQTKKMNKEITQIKEETPIKALNNNKNSHETILFEQEFEEKLSYLIDKLNIINRITK